MKAHSNAKVIPAIGNSTLRCIDLFAGAGGLSLAAQLAGLKVVAAVEHDKHACETYRRNFVKKGQPRLYEADITTLDPKRIARECFSKDAPCDIVLGGPPCQGFSVHRIKDAGKNDPRNRLIHRYFEFVAALKPKIFLLENVPGILWPRHEVALRKFYSEAKKAGYKVRAPVVIDARDYGVPQRRRRVFILGHRNDVHLPEEWFPAPTHGPESKELLDSQLKPWIACSEVFKEPIKGTDSNDIHMNHSKELVAAFENTPRNGGSRKDSGRTLPCHKYHDGHKDVYGRIDPTKPGPTMTTACINPSKGRFLHPVKNCGISLRHAARMQTFPDDFVFCGGLIAGGVQVGNAVPIKLGEALLRHLKSKILSRRVRIKRSQKKGCK
jgi:DNA (cytosine-5)-methyltransferase 1